MQCTPKTPIFVLVSDCVLLYLAKATAVVLSFFVLEECCLSSGTHLQLCSIMQPKFCFQPKPSYRTSGYVLIREPRS